MYKVNLESDTMKYGQAVSFRQSYSEVKPAISFSYTVKTIPPLSCEVSGFYILDSNSTRLTISRARRGVVPPQSLGTPSSLMILRKQSKLFRYRVSAPIDCIRVLILSSGIVVSGRAVSDKLVSRSIVTLTDSDESSYCPQAKGGGARQLTRSWLRV